MHSSNVTSPQDKINSSSYHDWRSDLEGGRRGRQREGGEEEREERERERERGGGGRKRERGKQRMYEC